MQEEKKIDVRQTEEYKLALEVERNLKKTMSTKEYEEYKARRNIELLNSKKGNLPFYNCSKCLNRGFINYYKIENNHINYYVKQCECNKIRKPFIELSQSGLGENLLTKTLDNFSNNDEWQQILKNKVSKYLNEFKEDINKFKKWLFISGQSGVGKTHLCTAIFKELVMQGKTGKYMMWKDETPIIKVLKKSTYNSNQEKYAELINELKTVDVLYIDDLFKLMDNISKNEDLSIAYEIINTRYITNKITIFSSEKMRSEIEELDSAIFGRIFEKCGLSIKNGLKFSEYWIELKKEKNRDFRLKNSIKKN